MANAMMSSLGAPPLPHARAADAAAQFLQACAAAAATSDEPSCGMGLVAASTVSFSEVSAGSALATSSLFPGRTDSGLVQIEITADGPFGKALASLPMATDSFISRPDGEHHAAMCWDVMASCPAGPAWDQPVSPTKRPSAPQYLASGVIKAGGLNLQDLEEEFLRRVQRPAVAVEAGVLRAAGLKQAALTPPRCSTNIGNLASMLALTPAGAAAMRAAHSGGSFSSATRLLVPAGDSSRGGSFTRATHPAARGSRRSLSGGDIASTHPAAVSSSSQRGSRKVEFDASGEPLISDKARPEAEFLSSGAVRHIEA